MLIYLHSYRFNVGSITVIAQEHLEEVEKEREKLSLDFGGKLSNPQY